jgi:hypothetical protein
VRSAPGARVDPDGVDSNSTTSGTGGRDTAERGSLVRTSTHNGASGDSTSTNPAIRGAIGASIPGIMELQSTAVRPSGRPAVRRRPAVSGSPQASSGSGRQTLCPGSLIAGRLRAALARIPDHVSIRFIQPAACACPRAVPAACGPPVIVTPSRDGLLCLVRIGEAHSGPDPGPSHDWQSQDGPALRCSDDPETRGREQRHRQSRSSTAGEASWPAPAGGRR